jgi:hypothetical protein
MLSSNSARTERNVNSTFLGYQPPEENFAAGGVFTRRTQGERHTPGRCARKQKEEGLLKKVATLTVAVMALLGLTSIALAQYPLPNITLDGSVTPAKGGSKKKPRKTEVKLAFTVNKESRVTADQIIFFTPSNLVLSGKNFRYCTSTQIATNGVASCPKGSQIGSGSATAVLGPRQAPLSFKITMFWASVNQLTFYLEQEGGSLKVPLSGPITKGGAPYGQKITVDIPNGVSQPAPGTYSQITGVTAIINGETKKKVTVKKKGKKRKVTKKFFAANLTGCPKDRTHDYLVRLRFIPNPNPPQAASAQQGDTQGC